MFSGLTGLIIDRQLRWQGTRKIPLGKVRYMYAETKKSKNKFDPGPFWTFRLFKKLLQKSANSDKNQFWTNLYIHDFKNILLLALLAQMTLSRLFSTSYRFIISIFQ